MKRPDSDKQLLSKLAPMRCLQLPHPFTSIVVFIPIHPVESSNATFSLNVFSHTQPMSKMAEYGISYVRVSVVVLKEQLNPNQYTNL